MASFKTHVRLGALIAFFMTILSYILGWTLNFAMSIILFFTTLVGSFLPDMDSDSGLPIQIIFSLYSYFAAGVTFYFMWNSDLPGVFSIVAPVGSYAIVDFIIQPWFKKQTSHRGIYHSVPAVLLSFFITLFIVSFFKITLYEKFAFALALMVGYLSHLVLDEFSSIQRKKGKIVKLKSFGTALDFGFEDKKTGVLAYLLLAVMIFFTFPELKALYKAFF